MNARLQSAIMAASESPLNLVRGPARNPGWAQLVRLGGDRIAILFDELRKSVGRMDGVVEQLRYAAAEGRWFVAYQAGGTELFTVRISPGLLEAGMSLSPTETETVLASRKVSGNIKDEIRAGGDRSGPRPIRFHLRDRRGVRSFVNLLLLKDKLASNSRRGNL